MIATLEGRVAEKYGDQAVVEIGGVGYEVTLTVEDWGRLKVGENTKLYIYENVREDAYNLFGFAALPAKQLYMQLLGVSGVGPKLAMQTLSGASVERLQQAIAAGDPALLKGISGVGAKTAERIVVELKGKIKVSEGAFGTINSGDSVYQALVGLGYSAAQAAEAAASVPAEVTSESERVKLALKQLSR
jgi:Holliday junction DNA helicase RuvA